MTHPSEDLLEDLLIEIGLEEMPPDLQPKLIDNFAALIASNIKEKGLAFNSIEKFLSPRRLGVIVHQLQTHQSETKTLKKGPAVNMGLDAEGKPTKALLGFAKSCGVDISSLQQQTIQGTEFFTYEITTPGKNVASLIPEILQKSIKEIPLQRRMRWGDREDSFIRPVHWLVVLLGNTVIETSIFGVASGRNTFGHRFLHPQAIALQHPSDYYNALKEKGYVLAGFKSKEDNDCRNEILRQMAPDKFNEILRQMAPDKINVQPLFDFNLLDENAGLVEWPEVMIGAFDKQFLNLPREVLISSMQYHQKCFAIKHRDGSLLPYFVIISNIKTSDSSLIIDGNERVMHARLADAEFHYHTDLKHTLESRLNNLKTVIFQAGLGSLWDKTERLKSLSERIAENIGASIKDTARAALLCKTDLLTQMVGEFPELQGVMGRYYAKHDGESSSVADALAEYYHPRFANDQLPATKEGAALAIADRVDTLVGIFGLGKRPTSEKDPFGLRRHALGVLRIIIENKFDLDLKDMFTYSETLYALNPLHSLPNKSITEELLQFSFDRLKAWYIEQGFSPKLFEAVMAKKVTKPYDFHKRMLAVLSFSALSESSALATANKRVQNILTKSNIRDISGISDISGIPSISDAPDISYKMISESSINSDLLQAPAEINLAKALKAKLQAIVPLKNNGDYTELLSSLAELKDPIDTFFDEVMVMVEDELLRKNRLALLQTIRSLFLEVADISEL